MVYDLMEPPRGALSPDDDLAWAMENMERYACDRLVVVSQDGQFLGFVSHDRIFARYRKLVRETSDF